MVLTSENIKEANLIESNEIESLSSLLLGSVSVDTSDNEKSIEKKIETLLSLKQYLLQVIDIDILPSKKEKTLFIRLLSKINQQIETFEILIGRIDIKEIEKAAITFSKKTQFPIGIYE